MRIEGFRIAWVGGSGSGDGGEKGVEGRSVSDKLQTVGQLRGCFLCSAVNVIRRGEYV